MRCFPVQLLLAVGLTWLSGWTSLECAHADSADYEDAIGRAVEEYSLGHWTEARFFFARAHTLHPNARTLRGLGLSSYESRNYVDAIGYFEQALASTEQPLSDELRTEVTARLAHAERLVTRVIVTLEPSDAALEVDHVPHELAADSVVWLDPGEHLLSASAQGHHPAQQTLAADGGERRVVLRLSPKPHGGPVEAPAAAAGSRAGGDLAPYVVIGAGAAALIVGSVLVGIAASDKNAVENPAGDVTWAELEPRYHRGRTFFPVGFALMGVGFAGVAAGLTWKLWPASQERAPSARLRVSPLGIELRGAF